MSQQARETNRLDVVYNDTCPICSREVNMYRNSTDTDVIYHGISECDLAQFGLTPDQSAREFHVMHEGKMVSGLAAFALLWERMPRLRWAAKLVRLPVLAPVLEWVYRNILARVLFAMHKRREKRAGQTWRLDEIQTRHIALEFTLRAIRDRIWLCLVSNMNLTPPL